MIKKTELHKGNFYFQISFTSPTSCIPLIRTFFYLGKNIFQKRKKRTEDEYYFQDAESYESKGSILDKGYDPQKNFILPLKEKHLVMIFDLGGLTAELQELKLKIPRMKNFKGKTIYIPY